MTNPAPGSFAAVLGALGTGLPILLLHLGVALALLAAGVAAYMAITRSMSRASCAPAMSRRRPSWPGR